MWFFAVAALRPPIPSMPPTRRDRSRPAATPPLYATKGWLSRCRRSTRFRNESRAAAGADDPLTILPDDLLFGSIFSRVFSDTGDVARCAATCRRWGRIVAARGAASAICRSLPPPDRLLPHLALGFFHGGTDDSSLRRRLLAASTSQPGPCFVPTASASRLLGSSFPGLLGGGSLFQHARPVASRNGLVVLELSSGGAHRADGIALGVCNPMTGDVALVPPLAGGPGHDYACALLTAEDLVGAHAPPRESRPGLLFSLVLVYNRRSFTALRCYTSITSGSGSANSSWGPETRKPGAKIRGHVLRHLGQAVVLAWVAYWPMYGAALGVRLDGAGEAVVDVCMVPYRAANSLLGYRLLGTTPEGRLSYIGVAECMNALSFQVETLDLRDIYDDMSTARDRWERREWFTLQHQLLKVSTTTELKLRWLCEKSGTLFFTVGEGGSTSGAFATRSLEKLADGVECNSWRNFCGFEMDSTALIASITARFA